MKIQRVKIENFRSIRHLSLDLGDSTVFIGPNNAGKTAILDAIQIALPYLSNHKGKKFNEHDIRIGNDDAGNPKKSDGAVITLTFVVQEPSVQNLGDILQLHPNSNHQFVTLRTHYKWNVETEQYEVTRTFLDAQGEPLVGSGTANNRNLSNFRKQLPLFYLGALRTVKDEFSPRSSQFWRRLLKAVKIPPDIESQTLEELNRLNKKVLQSDPQLRKITDTLKKATQIAVQKQEGGGSIGLQPLPSNISEVLSKIQIILRNESDSPWLPIQYHGEGIQSLLVLFLFNVFVESLLDEVYGNGLEPILLLEEPETHLHPHASRTLWTHVNKLSGQKIITTHSPYFVQHVPVRNLRLVRLSTQGTEVRFLQKQFSAIVPNCDDLQHLSERLSDKLNYSVASRNLTVTGNLDEDTYRKILKCYQHEDLSSAERAIFELRTRSSLYVSDDILDRIKTYAQRMRGEIFFAEGWLIVEGQSDFLIVHALACALNQNLDKHGISVIDAKNNGSPDTFAILARALNIPWQAVFDGDQAGKNYIKSIKKHGFTEDQINIHCLTHEAKNLEAQLIDDGFTSELCHVLKQLGISNPESLSPDKILSKLKNHKQSYAALFAERLRTNRSINENQLTAFQTAIAKLCQ